MSVRSGPLAAKIRVLWSVPKRALVHINTLAIIDFVMKKYSWPLGSGSEWPSLKRACKAVRVMRGK